MTYPEWTLPREVAGAKTVIRFTSPLRRGTKYTIARIDKQFYVLRYEIFCDGERIGQAADFPRALWQVTEDFACRLFDGPLGLFLLDKDRLTDLVWRFVRGIPEEKGGSGFAVSAYRPTRKPEVEPEPPRSPSRIQKPPPDVLVEHGFTTWEEAAEVMKAARERLWVKTAEVITERRR